MKEETGEDNSARVVEQMRKADLVFDRDGVASGTEAVA
jgi:hypothetical protein